MRVRPTDATTRPRGRSREVERPAKSDLSNAALRAAQARAERLAVQLTRTLEAITDGFYTLDRAWRFTYLNREAERIQHKTRAELLGRVVWEAFPEAVGTVFDTELHQAMDTGQTVVFEAFYPPLELWVAVRVFPSEDGLGVYLLDINAKHAAEQALAASEARYRALFERAGDAILVADDSGTYVDANESAAILLGLPREEIIGHRLNDFLVETLKSVDAQAAWNALRAAGEMRGELQLRRADGEILDAEYRAIADVATGLHLGVLRDITERRRHERSAAQRAKIIDALRRLSPGDDPEETANAICTEIVENGESSSAAIYAFGTEDGATAIGGRFRDGRGVTELPLLSPSRIETLQANAVNGPWVDEVGRPEDGTARAELRRLGVRAVLFAPIVSEGRLIGILAAGGEESSAELAHRLPVLVEFAALASSLLGPGLRRRAQRSLERARIRAVIASEAFRPVFQPIVDMANGRVLGYEALTRFFDNTPPDQAFQAAAEAGLGLELEAATIQVALSAAAPLPAECFLDINVSPNLVIAGEPLCQLLEDAAGGVVLEITEHVDVQDYPALRRAFAALGNDVRFAVDDAGAGFASLRHILELAPSHVKLDRALVARIDDDPARQALVTGLVHFAREIDVMLIAEGVETAGERDTLLDLGVHVGQGYFFGRPAPAAEAQIAASGKRRGKPTS